MERSAKVVCLGRLAGVDSLYRNLCAEDAEAKRYGEQFGDVDGPCGSPDKEDPMRILATGNVTVNQNEPPKASIMPSMANKLAKLALGGALLASGVGLGVGIPLMMGAFGKPEAAPAPTPAAAGGYEYLGRVFQPEGE